MKTPKPGTTSGFSRNFKFLIKWEFDKMGSFDQNPCSLERNGIPFYQEGTVQCILDKMGAHFTKTNMDFDEKLPFYRIPIFFRTQIFAKEAK